MAAGCCLGLFCVLRGEGWGFGYGVSKACVSLLLLPLHLLPQWASGGPFWGLCLLWGYFCALERECSVLYPA